jgi:hypothetical protein
LPIEEIDNPNHAEDRNFYKVEKSTKDGTKVSRMLYTGNNLERGASYSHRNYQTDDPAANARAAAVAAEPKGKPRPL